MKKLIIIAALAIPFGASAAPSERCQVYGELAAAIAYERDNGTPKTDLSMHVVKMNIDAERKLQVIELVDVIYSGNELAEIEPEVIGEVVMLACMKNERGR